MAHYIRRSDLSKNKLVEAFWVALEQLVYQSYNKHLIHEPML